MMKKRIFKTIIAVFLLIALGISMLFGCEGNKPAETAPETAKPASQLGNGSEVGTPAADLSETAMENFLTKIEAGDYVIDFGDSLKATVCSEDLVYYELYILLDGKYHDGFAVMTVNENETFEAYLDEDGISELSFVCEGKAIDVAAEGTGITLGKSTLPNYWIEGSCGNIWDLFYNDVDKPLEYVSNDDVLRSFVQTFAGVGEMYMKRMQEVRLVLDGEDPTEAHVMTSFGEGYPALDDIDIVITFGGAEADPRAEAWMNDPDREYPAAREDWGDEIIDVNAVFLPGYGETALPFPDFATYAFTVDLSAILRDDEVRIRDCRATEDDMRDYASKLEQNGFTETADERGESCYRLLLREEYSCYSSIYLDYDNGVNVVARKYYDCPTYTGLGEVNEVLSSQGFEELPENEGLTDFRGTDRACETVESWLYFFNYDTVLYVDVRFEDKGAFEDYIDAYIESLEGFEPDHTGGGEDDEYDEYDEVKAYLREGNELLALFKESEENVFYRDRTPEGAKSFVYSFDADGETCRLLFKSESFVHDDEITDKLEEAGFPVPDLGALDSCRDLVRFRKTMYGRDYPLDLNVAFTFETSAEAEDFLDVYVGSLTDDNGFDKANPRTIEMDKNWVYTKEVGDDLLAFGFDYSQGGTQINTEFRVSANDYD